MRDVHVQVQGQVGDEISVVSIDHDIVRSAKQGESDVHSAKRGENAKGPPNNFDEPETDLKTKKYLIPFLSKPYSTYEPSGPHRQKEKQPKEKSCQLFLRAVKSLHTNEQFVCRKCAAKA